MPGVNKELEHEKLNRLFGIVDILEEDNIAKHVCSVSIYIPSDFDVDYKSVAYYTGIVKHIELFMDRIENPESSLLYIYYDALFDASLDDIYSIYVESASEADSTTQSESGLDVNKKSRPANKVFSKAKQYMSDEHNSTIMILLILLYRDMLNRIIDDRARYSHVRLFSYDCRKFKNKDQYLGHPQVFGSIVRFLPIYDTRLEQVTLLNGSHAMTPRFARILSIFAELPNKHVISGFMGYQHREYEHYLDLLKLGAFKELFDNPEEEDVREVLFGGMSSIKPQLLPMYSMYNILIQMITLYNKTGEASIFKYGIDETILTYILILKDRSVSMSLLYENLDNSRHMIVDPSEYAKYVITCLTTYSQSKMALFPDVNFENLSRKVQYEITSTRRYNPIVLYSEDRLNNQIKPLFSELLNPDVIAELTSPTAIKTEFAGYHREIAKQLAGTGSKPTCLVSSMETLLYSLDEPKPLYIALFNSMMIYYPSVFTIINLMDYCVGDYTYESIADSISEVVFSYYRNPDKVLRKPYIVSPELNAGIFKKSEVNNAANLSAKALTHNIIHRKSWKTHRYGISGNRLKSLYNTTQIPSIENLNTQMRHLNNVGSIRTRPVTKKARMSNKSS